MATWKTVGAAATALTLLLPYSGTAFACPLAKSLVEYYGISFAGFARSIPTASAPATSGEGALVRIAHPHHHLVSDGFRHTLFLDSKNNKVWILRTGGLAGVHEWYGPVDAIDTSLENCGVKSAQPALADAT